MRFKNFINEDIENYLKGRDVDPHNNSQFPVFMDKEKNVAYFPLFNLSGKWTGYQRVNPEGTKTHSKDKIKQDDEKYYTYVTRENPEKNIPQISVYGLHTLDKRPFVFVTEGIFDAAKLIKLGLPAVAVLMNDPKIMKNFFYALQKKVIAIVDKDVAGNKLKKLGHYSYTVPDPYKDLGDMPLKEVREFIKSIGNFEI
jgi:hypothetical protein